MPFDRSESFLSYLLDQIFADFFVLAAANLEAQDHLLPVFGYAEGDHRCKVFA